MFLRNSIAHSKPTPGEALAGSLAMIGVLHAHGEDAAAAAIAAILTVQSNTDDVYLHSLLIFVSRTMSLR